MRARPSARLLVLDPAGHVLLFRFIFHPGTNAVQDFWATPGGGVDPGESFTEAAIRELAEETGIQLARLDPPVAERQFELVLINGETVLADERYFVVHTTGRALSQQGWTDFEREVMVEHRWWSIEELAGAVETIYPENLIELILNALTAIEDISEKT